MSCLLEELIGVLQYLLTGSECCRRAPLTQAACTAALYRHEAVQNLEKSAWRLLATEVVKMAADSEARHENTPHVVSLWLTILIWVTL